MMGALIAAACGLLVVGGFVAVVMGWRGAGLARPARTTRPVWTTVRTAWTGQPRTQRLTASASIIGGVLASLITGWWVFAALVPAAAIGLPWLLAEPPNREVDLLAALDRWVSLIATSLPTGKSIRDAIRTTRRQAPPMLERPVTLLLARLDDRWPARDAFEAMADELDSPSADTVLAALALASERGGTGASQTLRALSDNIQDHLKASREIETERAKPRIVVRQVTTLSVVVLGFAFVFGSEFFVPYRSPIGLAVLVVLLAAYVACLVMLRRMTTPAPRARLLARSGSSHD